MWERGLKLPLNCALQAYQTSLPMWERGLKFKWEWHWSQQGVAPHVGAWIEINKPSCPIPKGLVAPHVGAWIEINNSIQQAAVDRSLPMWERGLKCCRVERYGRCSSRSPCGSVD